MNRFLARSIRIVWVIRRLGTLSSERITGTRRRAFPAAEYNATEPGQDPYLDLLRGIQGNWHQSFQPDGDDENKPSDETQDEDVSGLPKLIPPSEPQLEQAHEAWLRTKQHEEASASDDDSPAKNYSLVNALLDKLNYDLPSVGTLSSTRDAYISKLTDKAQQAMRDEQYLDAQEHFRQVLSVGSHITRWRPSGRSTRRSARG